MKDTNVLAGDIGGTKTNLAVFNMQQGLEAPYPSRDYPSLEALVLEFLSGFKGEIQQASFGVAGPVTGGQATITNLHAGFSQQGAHVGILEDIPVGMIVNPKAALLGAACYGLGSQKIQHGEER